LAAEPPVLTTEMTCVAAPTDRANHGLPAAEPPGATAIVSKARHTAAHSSLTSRRTLHHRQVKL
jgi:hypothetical protein